jgi:hypothetical protein
MGPDPKVLFKSCSTAVTVTLSYLELEGDIVCAEIRLKLRGDVDSRRFASGVLDDKEELDDVAGLEDEVPLPFDSLGGQTTGNVGLTTQLSRWGRLKKGIFYKFIVKLMYNDNKITFSDILVPRTVRYLREENIGGSNKYYQSLI